MLNEKDLERAVEQCQKEHARYCRNDICYLSVGLRYVPCNYLERFESAIVGFNDGDEVLITLSAYYCNYEKLTTT